MFRCFFNNILFLCLFMTFLGGCGIKNKESKIEALADRNISGHDFDLKENEFILTFSFGPAPADEISRKSSLDLAKFLSGKKIPAVFFFLGSFAEAAPDLSRQIASLPFIAIGNGSYRPMQILGENFNIQKTTLTDLETADKILSPYFGDYRFFQAPFYVFSPDQKNSGFNDDGIDPSRIFRSSIKYLNMAHNKVLKDYIGPIGADIGGNLDYYDWSEDCRDDLDLCEERYLKQMTLKTMGVVSFHDLFPDTRSMFLRDDGKDFLTLAQNKGFSFVSIMRNAKILDSLKQGNFANFVEEKGQMTCSENEDFAFKEFDQMILSNYSRSKARAEAGNQMVPGSYDFNFRSMEFIDDFKVFYRSSNPPGIEMDIPNKIINHASGFTEFGFSMNFYTSAMKEWVVVTCKKVDGGLKTSDRIFFSSCITGKDGIAPQCY